MTQEIHEIKYGVILRNGRPMATLGRAVFGDGALSEPELNAFRNEVIAALNNAPVLREAFKALIPLASEAIDARKASADPEDNDADLIALYEADIEAARAAIAKASGEAPTG